MDLDWDLLEVEKPLIFEAGWDWWQHRRHLDSSHELAVAMVQNAER